MLIRRIHTRSSVSICGRPPEDRDFQRRVAVDIEARAFEEALL
jgi:hypothetical protein